LRWRRLRGHELRFVRRFDSRRLGLFDRRWRRRWRCHFFFDRSWGGGNRYRFGLGRRRGRRNVGRRRRRFDDRRFNGNWSWRGGRGSRCGRSFGSGRHRPHRLDEARRTKHRNGRLRRFGLLRRLRLLGSSFAGRGMLSEHVTAWQGNATLSRDALDE